MKAGDMLSNKCRFIGGVNDGKVLDVISGVNSVSIPVATKMVPVEHSEKYLYCHYPIEWRQEVYARRVVDGETVFVLESPVSQ